MPSFTDARSLILESVAPLGCETVPLLEASGRVLGQDIRADRDLPGYDYSAMDGYGIRVADAGRMSRLPVCGYLPAGGNPCGISAATAVRIMTGAPIPEGCDAVVPIEETEEDDGQVRLLHAVTPGQHIRRRGGDLRRGELVLPSGSLLRAPEVSMLASLGRQEALVHRKARVAILSTGDELVELGTEPGPGQVINSNAVSLAASVLEAGGVPIMLGIARDDRDELREKLRLGLQADLLITSAGVSAGDRDYVREVLAELGAEQRFWKIAMKPGGPTAFSMYGPTPIFSLPGNPVSTMVTFELLVKPALLRMMGHRQVVPETVEAFAGDDLRGRDDKLTFVRVAVRKQDGRLVASTSGDQHTANLRTMVRANGLVALPPGSGLVPAGSVVQLYLLDEPVRIWQNSADQPGKGVPHR